MEIDNSSKDLLSDLASVSKKIDDTIGRIEKDATAKERRSSRERGWDIFFRTTIAILAVASPALVTYSTTAGVAEPYKLAAILLSGIAGASATLQAIFALQQNYVRNAIDALDLYDLKAQLQSNREEALRMGKDHDKYSKLNEALNDATKRYKEIIIGRQKAYFERSLPAS